MVSKIIKSDCCGCGTCQFICPTKCISMESDEEGFLYPKINKDDCKNCGICIDNCSVTKKNSLQSKRISFAAYNLDDEIRYYSSSGGIFYLISDYIINKKGIVYGVICDTDMIVKHIRAANIDEVLKMLGAKYVQSDTNDTFEKVACDLLEGKNVLYSGTPCQISGLTNYLRFKKIDLNNLYTVDIICHGVPSPKIWEFFKKEVIGQNSEQICNVNFRDKITGWKNYSLTIKSNKISYQQDANRDAFLLAFRKNMTLRPSCYKCRFKGAEGHCSDLTLGDFWGFEQEIEELYDDDRGVSWITANTDKGEQLLKVISSKMWCRSVSVSQGEKHNSSSIQSVSVPKNRDAFFSNVFYQDNFNKYVLKSTGESGLIGVLKKIKRKLC